MPAQGTDHEKVLEHAWQLRALDDWRKDLDRRVAVLESQIVTEQQARALTEALKRRDHIRLTGAQRAAAGLVGLVAVADFIRALVMG